MSEPTIIITPAETPPAETPPAPETTPVELNHEQRLTRLEETMRQISENLERLASRAESTEATASVALEVACDAQDEAAAAAGAAAAVVEEQLQSESTITELEVPEEEAPHEPEAAPKRLRGWI